MTNLMPQQVRDLDIGIVTVLLEMLGMTLCQGCKTPFFTDKEKQHAFVVFTEIGSFDGTVIFIHEECLTAKLN